MTSIACRITVSASQLKSLGVHELGDSGKRMLLSMARRAILSIAALVNIPVAVGATLIESQKTFLPDCKERHVCIRMAIVATDRNVFSPQMKIQTLVSKVNCIIHARQLKAACVGDSERLAVVFRMARCAVGGHVGGKIAVETASENEL